MTAFWYALGPFLCGSIPTAYIFGRYFKNVDIRQHGSGNVGATNAFRVLGKKLGAAVFVIDFLKGLLPVLVLENYFQMSSDDALWFGSAAILGHIFTPFLKFRGGKGVATGAGVVAGSYPPLILVALVAWVAVFICTRLVAVASLAAAGTLPLASFFLPIRPQNILFLTSIFLLIVWTHRSNIQRLIRKQETKL